MHKIIVSTILTLALGWTVNAQVTVSPGNLQGWSLFTTDSGGNVENNGNTAQIVSGPATPPLGSGSVQLATAANQGDSGAILTTFSYDGDLLSSINALSYDTYDTANNGQQFPYVAITVSTDGTGNPTTLDTLFFEPPYQTPGTGNPSLPNQGSTSMNQWQGWNALSGGWWDNNGIFGPGTGVNSLAAFLALYPNATIEDGSDLGLPAFGGIAFQVGYASPTDNFNGYVDDVTIGTTGGTTTYDFEPGVAPIPEPTTVMAGALMLLPLGIGGYRALRRKQANA